MSNANEDPSNVEAQSAINAAIDLILQSDGARPITLHEWSDIFGEHPLEWGPDRALAVPDAEVGRARTARFDTDVSVTVANRNVAATTEELQGRGVLKSASLGSVVIVGWKGRKNGLLIQPGEFPDQWFALPRKTMDIEDPRRMLAALEELGIDPNIASLHARAGNGLLQEAEITALSQRLTELFTGVE